MVFGSGCWILLCALRIGSWLGGSCTGPSWWEPCVCGLWATAVSWQQKLAAQFVQLPADLATSRPSRMRSFLRERCVTQKGTRTKEKEEGRRTEARTTKSTTTDKNKEPLHASNRTERSTRTTPHQAQRTTRPLSSYPRTRQEEKGKEREEGKEKKGRPGKRERKERKPKKKETKPGKLKEPKKEAKEARTVPKPHQSSHPPIGAASRLTEPRGWQRRHQALANRAHTLHPPL